MKYAGEQSTTTTGAVTISGRKLQANRENGKKSGGPKTPRGKAYSRMNALKHGFYARSEHDFLLLREDPEDYEELLTGVKDRYQPLGILEEVETERIAVLYWRSKRVRRWLDAVIRTALRDERKRELDYQLPWSKQREADEQAVIRHLQKANEEIVALGEISPELKQKIFAIVPDLEGIWPSIERDSTAIWSTQEGLSMEKVRSLQASDTARMAIAYLQWIEQGRTDSIDENCHCPTSRSQWGILG